NNDGYETFDLPSRSAEIANDEANVEITYYPTEAAAEGGDPADELPDAYTNTSSPEEVVYARSENTETGCYAVVEHTLRVLPSPELPEEIPDLFACTDGDTAVFDLTENADVIYGDQSPDDYGLTYHESEADAEEGTAAIGQPGSYAYSGPGEGTIWVRLEDRDSGCYSVGSFTIGVGDALEVGTPDPLVSCDGTAGGPDDGIGLFDLTVAVAQITGGNASYEVIFYADGQALEEGDPITDPEHYENETNAQTLPVVVIGSEGCEAETTLTLVVVPDPQLPEELDPLEECDADNDGFAEFDLQAEAENLLNGQPDVEITF